MSVLSAATSQQLEDVLVADGALSKAVLASYKRKAQKTGTPLFSLLIQDGKVNEEAFTRASAQVNNIPYVNLSPNPHISAHVLSLLPKDTAVHYMAVPLGESDNRLVVAMLNADNVQAVDFLSKKIGRPLKVYAASEAGIIKVIKQYDKNIGSGVASILVDAEAAAAKEAAKVEIANPAITPKKAVKVQEISGNSPIAKVLNALLEYAAKNQASDIHIEPQEELLKVRCRVDGVLREVMTLPKSSEPALISRVKILSELKIDEHRTPQDGQFTIKVDNQEIDMRIAISPTVWGEQVIMRLLDKSGQSFVLENMGYTGRTLRLIRKGIKRPYGMVLTSGPTGSGKSTSMYAMIQEIKNVGINIVTLEDPVEYKIDGVNQIQVNADVGLTFATGLRSILRQDPDVVMVGEIRDKETANLAVQAALTGHLVFSTLHTNTAAGILPRLLDMGIEPFLIASTVHTVIGQRLVRRLAASETYSSNKVESTAINQALGTLLPKTKEDMPKIAADLGYKTLPLANQSAYTLVKPQPMPDNPTGYKGRMGLYEAFEVTEKIQDLILKRSTSSTIQKAAQTEGMVTMRQDGYLKALANLTTLNEVNRVATDS